MRQLYKHFVTLLCAAILTSGCASERLSKTALGLVENGQKAVAVLDCHAVVLTGNVLSWLGPKKPHEFICNTTWRNISSGEEFMQIGGDSIASSRVYVLTPGVYSLSAIHVPEAVGYTYSARDLSNIAQFEVKGGEVVYLGDVMLNIHQSSIIAKMVDIADRRDVATAVINKNNPELAGRLSTRLITLSKMVEVVKKTNLILNSVPSSQR